MPSSFFGLGILYTGGDRKMLYNLGTEDLFKNYFNLNENRNNILNPKEGLILGNMFFDMYIPYKNYKPRELVAKNEKDKMMLRIRELSQAVNDLNLYLDLNPDDKEVYALFKKYVKELNECVSAYSAKYEPLELCKDTGDKYSWVSGTWPWEEQ